ncbi:MAG: RimK/LysX family protein [Nanobdellota archaeon]
MTFAGDKKYDDCVVVGFVEHVTCFGKSEKKTLPARIDTGATKSSIDERIVKELDIGPFVGERIIRTVQGTQRRKIVRLKIRIGEKTVTTKFTVADRSQLKYPILIGRNILRKGFLIDPTKKSSGNKQQRQLQSFKEKVE